MTPRNKILLVLFFCVLFVACKKTGVSPSTQDKSNNAANSTGQALIRPQLGSVDPALVGTWQLVSDSTSSYSQDAGSHGSTYIGTATDQFTFAANGTAYINEHAVTDTGYYGVDTDHSLQILYQTRVVAGVTLGGSADFFHISSIDSHNALFSNAGWSPAGVYFVRVVKLTR